MLTAAAIPHVRPQPATMEGVTNAGPGRPRLTARRRPGGTARAEILDAAAELFTTRGFAATSTRHIAEAVGMRQASLYNHFATKDDILVALLADTVTPALDFAENLRPLDTAPEVKLYALSYIDAAQLITGRWNLGVLYLLPELRSDRFMSFRADRDRLREQYRALAQDVLDAIDDPSSTHQAELPFRLVESVISARADALEGTPIPDAAVIAGSALHILGWRQDLDPIHTEAATIIANAETPKLSGAASAPDNFDALRT